jgi:hypothetical protein
VWSAQIIILRINSEKLWNGVQGKYPLCFNKLPIRVTEKNLGLTFQQALENFKTVYLKLYSYSLL